MDRQPIFLIFPERQMPVDADIKSVSQKANASSWKYAKPFVKWAGGKSQLLTILRNKYPAADDKISDGKLRHFPLT